MAKINLYDFEILNKEVFYKCQHILSFLEKNENLSELDRMAIKATIMDALVTKKLIDPNKQSLDLEHLCIVDDLEHYTYEEHPNICGIPLWMKEKFRQKSIYISGGIPISIFLAKPPSKTVRYCVYDPNTAVSSIFDDATFYNAIYTSPTRGITIEESRPFVEVNINGEDYLVDTLTKRILKSSWFKENFDFKEVSKQKISTLSKEKRKMYQEQIQENNNLGELLPITLMVLEFDDPQHAEMKYEVEQSKKYYKEEWEKSRQIEKEFESFKQNGYVLIKKDLNEE